MKKIIFLSLAITMLFMIIASRCKPKEDTRPYGPQYEEDPGPERGTLQERLNGDWRIEDYQLNGVSIMQKMNAAVTGTINLSNTILSYRFATKDNGWTETRSFEPWKYGYFDLSKDTIRTHNAFGDSTFCYFFGNPESKICIFSSYWKITKLYKNRFNIQRTNNSGSYKILWKR